MQHTLLSRTTAHQNREHLVTTSDRDFAFALFEQALEVDIDPDFTPEKGAFSIGFICSDAECAAAIEAAKSYAVRGMVEAA